MNTLEAALAELELVDRKAAEFKQEQKELNQRKADNDSKRKRLIKVVKLFSPNKSAARSGKRPSAKPVKPSVRKPDVEAVCLALVKDNPEISKQELKDLALHNLTNEQGFGRNGAALQIDKCLLSEQFVIAADDTVSLVGQQSVQQTPKANDRMQLPVDKTARRGFLG